jgi:hypothetical protein
LESLREVVCALSTCRLVFYLCRFCDRNDRYCTDEHATLGRSGGVRAGGARQIEAKALAPFPEHSSSSRRSDGWRFTNTVANLGPWAI